MTAARITKRSVVMERRWVSESDRGRAWFSDTPRVPTYQVEFPAADFTALGSPERITVTIEPGDRLTEEDQ